MLFNGTCVFRECFFTNGSKVEDQHLNPSLIDATAMNIDCTPNDTYWAVLKAQNSKMPSDEYFQYVETTLLLHFFTY